MTPETIELSTTDTLSSQQQQQQQFTQSQSTVASSKEKLFNELTGKMKKENEEEQLEGIRQLETVVEVLKRIFEKKPNVEIPSKSEEHQHEQKETQSTLQQNEQENENKEDDNDEDEERDTELSNLRDEL